MWEQRATVNPDIFRSRQKELLYFEYIVSCQVYYGVLKGRLTVFFAAKVMPFQRPIIPHVFKKLAYENSTCAFPCFVKILVVNAPDLPVLPQRLCLRERGGPQSCRGCRKLNVVMEFLYCLSTVNPIYCSWFIFSLERTRRLKLNVWSSWWFSFLECQNWEW